MKKSTTKPVRFKKTKITRLTVALHKLALLCLICLLTTTSCKDSFLEIQPDDTLLEAEFIQNAEDLQEVLNAAYKYLGDGNFMSGSYWLLSDLAADQIEGDRLSNGNWQAHYTRTTDIFLDTTRDLMKAAGRCNAYANLVLSKLDEIDLSSAERERMRGECHFIRAVMHFELVKVFAQPFGFKSDNSQPGISIWTEVTAQPQPRATVAEVYSFVLSELKSATIILPNSNGFYADKQAAQGYLAKVYFQMNDFTNAYTYADLVIGSEKYSLGDLDQRFSDVESMESVFQLVSGNNADIGTYNIGSKLNDLYNITSGLSPSVTVSNAYFNQFSADFGNRAAWFEVTGDYIALKKFPSDSDFNVPLVHLTELKLIRAESAAENNNNLEQAAQDLNDIRVRAGLSGIPLSSSAEEIIGIARQERNIEMVLEGNRLHERKRIAVRDSPNLLIREAIWNCPGMIFQFPDDELKGNPDFGSGNEQAGC